MINLKEQKNEKFKIEMYIDVQKCALKGEIKWKIEIK